MTCGALLLFLGSVATAAEAPVDVGTVWNFHGSVESRVEGAGGNNRKTFDLMVCLTSLGPTGAQACWVLDERGRGEWPWTGRFGRAAFDGHWQLTSDGPSLLYARDDGRVAIPLVAPLWGAENPLVVGTAWMHENLEYRAEQAARRGERDVWQISASDKYGIKRTLWVDQHSPVAVSMTERVIMGRGEEHQLQVDLIGSEKLAAESLATFQRAFDGLDAVRGKLNLPPDSQEVDWQPKQLKLLERELPKLATQAAGTPLERLVDEAQRDAKLQTGRNDAIAELVAKFVGQGIEEFSLSSSEGDSLSHNELAGKVTVLHFWEYRDQPLKEPYGQVGYLDYLKHLRERDGLKVYGVAVDGRLADESTRAVAQRSVKKLKEFMNLSFPVLLDAGPAIKLFGDPRLHGAGLPLFVVIGRDGKIVHYHVGCYEVKAEQGLAELDAVVGRALDTK